MGVSHYWSRYGISCGDYSFETTVTSSGDAAADWINSVLSMDGGDSNNTIVGVDTEWVPGGAAGFPGKFQVGVLQLCVGRRCLVFQLLHCHHLPQTLIDFLKDDRFYFIGMSIHSELEKLSNQFPPLKVEGRVHYSHGVHDLRDLAAWAMDRQDVRRWAFKDLVREIIKGTPLEMPINISNSIWGREELEHDQIEYAALKAFASYEIGKKLLFGMGRQVDRVGKLQLA
ncbi:hypothetical protein LUZ62_032108 [Rhynchospora pubera]|uniref:3'-5' exonuclease domain-containing protein n=1 Tax=Rhynchospora pubera TaxID=906938 RepID=A0AAV8HWV2_9POAL|nr:hypothetical protein LUZ62_032108 [Rhynchospora pubera]